MSGNRTTRFATVPNRASPQEVAMAICDRTRAGTAATHHCPGVKTKRAAPAKKARPDNSQSAPMGRLIDWWS